MNAVEIAEAVSELVGQPFDANEFPYQLLESFGNKESTIKRLRAGATNKSDLGGVLQTNNIHIAVATTGNTSAKLAELKASTATSKAKAKFILTTDGDFIEAEDINTGETMACPYQELPNHFGFLLALAGISTVQQIRDSSFDIRATGRLNKLYVELLKDNPEWGQADRRHEMNHFMARLIFCFFAEDTRIFRRESLFTQTIAGMSAKDSENTHEVIGKIFLAMNTKIADRESQGLPAWISEFPYVNGGLFSGSTVSPRFSRIARSYLLHIGNLDWTEINPDIFGSMIQAVADDEERGELGMHYTSVPNILKVLNPLFLDDLREELEEAGDNQRSLLNLRKRLSRIRVLDPACGSGNFLVIAYREMRAIEAEINERRREEIGRPSEIRLTNFRGIELRDFPAEIARLALIIAEYQCDVHHRGERLALAEFLPLDGENWITCGNALRLDWQSICPPTRTGIRIQDNDLFNTPLDQTEIDFENEGGETYICGNPPYKGSQTQTKEQKADLAALMKRYGISSKQIDYVGGWFLKAAEYISHNSAASAFVSTNSICQGRIVPILWPVIFEMGVIINFAYTSFKWANLASYNAGVTVAIVGLSCSRVTKRYLFTENPGGSTIVREGTNITSYLTIGNPIIVDSKRKALAGLHEMCFGNMPVDDGHLLLSADQMIGLDLSPLDRDKFVRRIYGSAEFIKGRVRYCLWIKNDLLARASNIGPISSRIEEVKAWRLKSRDAGTKKLALRPHQFREMHEGNRYTLILPGVSSESREFLTVGLLGNRSVVSNLAFALYDAPLWNMALLSSKIHLIWIATVCGKLETRYRYSNTLGWNTFPVPTLTEKNKQDLIRCAEDILLAREAHFPATIAKLYEPGIMPEDLQAAHDRNDEVVERIYIGRRFRNDTERLEKLFTLYSGMVRETTAKKCKADR
jgi:hypothetical protein